MNLYVYYDDSYKTSWLSDEISLQMTDFLHNKGFHVLNAEQLAEIMKKSVDNDTCWKDLVVFSRDIVPETICHYIYANELIREYLDRGGTIIWLGDIPFYYLGLCPAKSNRLEEQLKQASPSDIESVMKNRSRDEKNRFADCYNVRGSFNVLGVVSLITTHTSSKVKISRTGRKLGLLSQWYSTRAILIRGSNLRKNKPVALATGKPLYMMPFERSIIGEKKERRFSSGFIDLFSKILGLIPALAAMTTTLYLLWAGFATVLISSTLSASAILLIAYVTYWLFWSRATYAGAWFKSFDKRQLGSGFYRLWDFRLHRITTRNLEELHKVIMTIVERSAR